MAVPQVMECVLNASKMHYGGSNLHQLPVQRQWCQVHPQVSSVLRAHFCFINALNGKDLKK